MYIVGGSFSNNIVMPIKEKGISKIFFIKKVPNRNGRALDTP